MLRTESVSFQPIYYVMLNYIKVKKKQYTFPHFTEAAQNVYVIMTTMENVELI